ncbi:hydantoinase/oxoprolinase family protein [Roseomonas terrae]|jgi:N-methylhydantoinase A/oxoprolinase/acetone carboxylase beta subunit|uniref:Hydantoinase/oxoprolinase family protein n=1 Tax=Neoroseomonas terrae TaxID=424799 RepID=A0ABS5EBE0_9PROT|nr:hydantoinase/oxoprolinase family protein [Neoroseomonas terrae]MBR0648338.1 hydantoinase/oxoprolinase family protein [Neoroseomonas terrae]
MIRIATDIGGTFTDLALDAGGTLVTGKVLTTPAAPEQGVLSGLRDLLAGTGVKPAEIGLFLHGTTLATNAVIERKGARTALVMTEGFTDTPEIGREHRFDQYNVYLEKPSPLVPRERRFGLRERIDADGGVIEPLTDAEIARVAALLRDSGAASVAVCLLHSYANPAHEEAFAAALARLLPGVPVSLSCRVSPLIGEYERCSTTCANAYVQPLVATYLARMQDGLRGLGITAPVLVMMSEGALASVDTASHLPVRLIESGPAGGAMLAAAVARRLKRDRLVAFDMGGTTAKICLIENGRPTQESSFEADRIYRFKKGSGLPLRIPVVELVEIGAGGGSIARVDGAGRLLVGPDSAGADPGPACYGRGGDRPTVTDANLLLGRITPARFAGGRMALDRTTAAQAMRSTLDGLGLGVEASAAAVAEIVEEAMAAAARTYAAEKGCDLAGWTLLAFGGAAGLHAASVAKRLGIAEIVLPPNAGVGSAIGFLVAPAAFTVKRSAFAPLASLPPAEVATIRDAMRREAQAMLAGLGDVGAAEETWTLDLRYTGQGTEVTLPLEPDPAETLPARLTAAFESEYERRLGLLPKGVPIEIAAWSLTVTLRAEPTDVLAAPSQAATPAPIEEVRLYDLDAEAARPARLAERSAMPADGELRGPALLVEDHTTLVIPAGMAARCDAEGFIILRSEGDAA